MTNQNSKGEAIFAEVKRGYDCGAVNEYIFEMNRRFEDAEYTYKKRILELERALDEAGVDRAELGSKRAPMKFITRNKELMETIANLQAKLSESAQKLGNADAEREIIIAERDALIRKNAELSAELKKRDIELELAKFAKSEIVQQPLEAEVQSADKNDSAQLQDIHDADKIALTQAQAKDESDKSDKLAPIQEASAEEIHKSKSHAAAESEAADPRHADNADNIIAQAKREACLIKHEAYLKSKLMLDRLRRKLDAQITMYSDNFAKFDADADHALMRKIIDYKIKLDDLNYTAEDMAKEVLTALRQ